MTVQVQVEVINGNPTTPFIIGDDSDPFPRIKEFQGLFPLLENRWEVLRKQHNCSVLGEVCILPGLCVYAVGLQIIMVPCSFCVVVCVLWAICGLRDCI